MVVETLPGAALLACAEPMRPSLEEMVRRGVSCQRRSSRGLTARPPMRTALPLYRELIPSKAIHQRMCRVGRAPD